MMKNVKAFTLISFFFLLGCKSELKKDTILLFNLNSISEKEKNILGQMNLDENYPNLLNPKISDDNYKKVYQSWQKLHSDLYKFLKKNNFEWNSDLNNIKLFNKIYFTKKGKIEIYVYRIISDISEEKTIEYGQLVKKFAKNIQINVEREDSFAQCGKASLPNNKK